MRRLMVMLVIWLFVVGCAQLGQPSAEEIVHRAEAAIESLDRAHAIVELEATVEGETMRVLGEGWVAGEQKRAEVLEASEPALVGALLVSDGERGWFYHPEMSKALTGSVEELEAYQDEQMEGPLEFDFASLMAMADELLRITDQDLVGEERIAELDAWHLRLTPNEAAPPAWVAVGGTVDLWISKAHDIPLQVAYSGSSMGEGRMTVQQYDADATFADDIFTFTPPSTIEVVDVATLLPERITLPEARAATPFPLLSTAADSAEATLVDVYRVGESFVQEFEGTLGEWTLLQGMSLPAHPQKHEGGEAQSVLVRGQKGELWSDSEKGWTMLSWTEDGTTIGLTGRVSPDTALELAGTLE